MNPYPFNPKVTKYNLPIGKWHTDSWKGIKESAWIVLFTIIEISTSTHQNSCRKWNRLDPSKD